MSLFKAIRSVFGLKIEIEDSPIEKLQSVDKKLNEAKANLLKAQSEYDEIDNELSLKIKGCDVLIQKGSVEEGEFNKKVINERLRKITDSFLNNSKDLYKSVIDLEEEKASIEGDIIAKSIEITSMLSDDDQEEIRKSLAIWKNTGSIAGDPIESHVVAIHEAIQRVILKSDDEEVEMSYEDFKKEHDRLLDVLANGTEEERNAEIKKQKKEADKYKKQFQKAEDLDDYVGHYVNAIIKDSEGKILFLKRADDDDFEPGKFCLPGGKIEEGETLDQAVKREVKEESNITIDACHCLGKIKCTDGKWAFYYDCYTEGTGDLALLDGESQNGQFMCDDDWSSADLLLDLKAHMQAILYPDAKEIKIEKGGEGSRGGKIIGHTKSGKPIYQNKMGWDYKDFTSDDHMDASDIHIKTSNKNKDNKSKKDHHFQAGHSHEDLVIDDDNNSSLKKAEDINPFETDSDGVFFLNKIEKGGKRASVGEVRVWKNKSYKKIANGKWQPINNTEPNSTDKKNEIRESSSFLNEIEKGIIEKTEQKYEACSVVRDGKEVYYQDGDKTSIQFPPEAIRHLKGSVFTHNHPSSRCFSKQDLHTTIVHQLTEMRAIAPKSAVGSVVFVFKNKGIPPDRLVSFNRFLNKVDADVNKEFQARIDKTPYKDIDPVINECNQTHGIEVMKRLKKEIENYDKDSDLNKWGFYWEKY